MLLPAVASAGKHSWIPLKTDGLMESHENVPFLICSRGSDLWSKKRSKEKRINGISNCCCTASARVVLPELDGPFMMIIFPGVIENVFCIVLCVNGAYCCSSVILFNISSVTFQ